MVLTSYFFRIISFGLMKCPTALILILVLLLSGVGCAISPRTNMSSRDAHPSTGDSDAQMARLAFDATSNPLPPEKGKELLAEMGGNWLYGQGLGETTLNVGAIVLFPPYAIYLLGNAAISLSGHAPLHFSDALPGEVHDNYLSLYDNVTSAPGRVSAAVAGEEFRTNERANENLQKVLASIKGDAKNRSGTARSTAAQVAHQEIDTTIRQ